MTLSSIATERHRDRLQAAVRRTFRAVEVRNYRLWLAGQGISLAGTWMQTVAQGLLVLQITGSGTALGIVTALQALPVLLLGPWGGVIADRLPKRTVLCLTQSSGGILGLVMGLLVLTGTIRLEYIYLLALGLGIMKAVDTPTRQSFVMEIVGPEVLSNAVTLNSVQVNLARVIGPTIAAVLIATVGIAWCFIIDGLSYFAVLAVLLAMRVGELHPTPRAGRRGGQLREGLRYVFASPVLSALLLMMALIGTFTYEFTVSLPVFSETSFGGGAAAYAAMTAAMGLGSVVGGLVTASQSMRGPAHITLTAAWFGVAVLLTALAPTLPLALVALLGVGYFSIQFTAQINATLQIESEPSMRGRVMALWAMAFLGSTPIGGPIIGAIAEHIGPRWALTVGGVTALAAAAIGASILRRRMGSPQTTSPRLP